jgi:hypothetical protein
MIARLTRSIETRGVSATIRSIGREALSTIANLHLRQHLLVPTEVLRNPRHAGFWLHDRLSCAGPAAQGLPWIAWPCIDFLNGYLHPEHRVFEWGGGGSTLFFLKKGCRVTTVESSARWVGHIESEIRKLSEDARDRWDLRFVPVTGNSDPAIDEYVGQVAAGAPWDVVMVDGWSRVDCLRRALPHVKPSGVLVLDNADQKQFENAPQFMDGWERHAFRGLGVARSWVTQTDVYQNLADSPTH